MQLSDIIGEKLYYSFSGKFDFPPIGNVKKYHVNSNITYKGTKTEFENIKNSIKKCDIYPGVNTKIYRKNANIPLYNDETFCISASLFPILYTMSFVKVSFIQEKDNEIILVISSCQENIINGYYRIICTFDGDNITIDYSKVQFPTTLFLRTISYLFNDMYVEGNKTSTIGTITKLSGKTNGINSTFKYI
jgi:hypothetical protein